MLVMTFNLRFATPIDGANEWEFRKELEHLASRGFTKARIDGQFRSLEDEITLDKRRNHTIEVVIDRLLVKPGIEKRLEAFVRVGHGIVVFPGGAGTAEEILYLLGILLDPANEAQPIPVVFNLSSWAEKRQSIADWLVEESNAKYNFIRDQQTQRNKGKVPLMPGERLRLLIDVEPRPLYPMLERNGLGHLTEPGPGAGYGGWCRRLPVGVRIPQEVLNRNGVI